MEELTGIVARAGFLPHGYCFQWSPGLLWTMVGSDLAIALAYFSIPLVIARYARQRPQVNLGSLATLFAVFIFACGITHVLDVWTIWRPDYELQTAGKFFTACASVLTAAVAWRLMPRLLAVPSADEMRAANEALRREMGRRHSAEDDLLETAQGLAAALSAIDAGFITTDGEGRVTRMNAVAERITGWPAGETLGRPLDEVFEREGAPAGPAPHNPIAAVRDGGYHRQAVCIARDGSRRPIEVHAGLTHHADGRERGVALIFRDIGRLTEAEAEVRRLAAVVESSADAILVKTLDGRITDWNGAAEKMFGYTAAQAVGQPVQMLIPPEREAEEMHVLASLAQGQQMPPLRTVRLARDGRRVEVSAQISPLRDAAGRIVGGVSAVRDLTHQRQIEAALRQSEARLRFALESAAIGDWEMELEGGRIHRSRRYDQCFGLPDGIGDWDCARMLAAVHAEDRAMVAAGLDALQGSTQGQLPWHAEFRITWPDDSLHWLRMDARVTRDDAGAARLVGIVADVTAMRTAEQARQQSVWLAAENRRVQESSRLKSLFLANMSHELRTPLNAVIGFADLLNMTKQPLDPQRQREWLQHIGSSGRQLLNLINDVLDLSKIEAGKMDFHAEPLDLPAVVGDVMATVAVLAEQRGLSLKTSIAPELRGLVLDPARLKQVLLNYLSNAIKFTPTGGRVELRMLGEGPRQWRLEVEDSGIGIPADRLGHLFVEFQQLDDGLARRHPGTGLGLALTRRLVEAQGGRVGVYSELGHGSRFYAVLPRQAEHAGAGAPTRHLKSGAFPPSAAMPQALYESSLTSLPLLGRGKVRENYAVGDDRILMVASDRLSAFDVIMGEPIPGKGALLTKMALFWFDKLQGIVPNHLTGDDPLAVITAAEREQIRDRAMLVKRLKPLPIEAVVRGYLAGSGWAEYKQGGSVCGVALPPGLRNADKLPAPIFTPATKAEMGDHDENISFEQAAALIGSDLATRVRDISIQLYQRAADFALTKGIIIADTKFEFGLDADGTLTLMDEVLTPDSSRYWPVESYAPGSNPPSYDKQFVRDWLEQATVDGKPWGKTAPAPALPADVIARTVQKYEEALQRLTA